MIQLPSEENLLLNVLNSMTKKTQLDPAELAAAYEHHFSTAVPATQGRQFIFDRFSLIDPTIRTVIQSTTAST